MAGLSSNATKRHILMRFKVSMILSSYLAKILVIRVFLYKNSIGTPFMPSMWRICCKTPPLARFDVSMISCLDLAQIWVTIVFLVKKNIGIMSMSKKWPICRTTLPFARFSAFQRFYDLMLRFGSNFGYKSFSDKKTFRSCPSLKMTNFSKML